ncbi:CatB-related O-acetyltransferase [Aureibaculum sp. 2210JD6-5]|uniref:xenobiotic acyltransferase family protein n=1 Tax=Aureibaculum sp. 2210JD6-5 TaxID=3103957 RepID=UPI002AAD9FEE|nr:CatB-related O-acetyltransferase [Aureibaculum sp. 2210JD6-5]MDY7394099.1 CatB-related O-acetyltransferase [Aureibaculum sp. 2210JD6-5]
MAFGINKKNILLLFQPKLVYAYYKRYKQLKKYKNRNLRLGLYVAINNSEIGNHVFLSNDVTLSNSKIGDHSYINSNTHVGFTIIGKFCSIASNIQFGLGKHPTHFVSTHPAFYANNKGFKTFSDKDFFEEHDKIILKNDVWIGNDSIIMSGVTIGNGAIVAAGSIVTKDVKPYEIVGGVPAKHIKFRIEERYIEQIQKTEWWDKEEEWLERNYKSFLNIEEFLKCIEKNE